METSSNIIVHSETIDKSEVQYKSPNMEREAVHRSLTYLKDKLNITVRRSEGVYCTMLEISMSGIRVSATKMH